MESLPWAGVYDVVQPVRLLANVPFVTSSVPETVSATVSDNHAPRLSPTCHPLLKALLMWATMPLAGVAGLSASKDTIRSEANAIVALRQGTLPFDDNEVPTLIAGTLAL